MFDLMKARGHDDRGGLDDDGSSPQGEITFRRKKSPSGRVPPAVMEDPKKSMLLKMCEYLENEAKKDALTSSTTSNNTKDAAADTAGDTATAAGGPDSEKELPIIMLCCNYN